ncbi:hypothetical protein B0H34DRAFT_670905 [Crassisporium funariophilum]|nr:hypothetical protein B0H34DRAFT_670905 [Crassisporium funariophilum]
MLSLANNILGIFQKCLLEEVDWVLVADELSMAGYTCKVEVGGTWQASGKWLQAPEIHNKLEDEPHLQYQCMVAMDGNNLLKHIRQIGTYLVADQEKKPSADPDNTEADNQAASKPVHPNSLDNPDPVKDSNLKRGGDPTNCRTVPCANNWKSLLAEELKQMWSLYQETGKFTCACQHGFILWVADMIRSGKLAKYPLAMIAKILKTLGPGISDGYDIGYSYSYTCPSQHHPNIIKGVGLKDLETLQRIFSGSNQLASVTQFATAYCHQVLINQYYHQWDKDKYENLGLCIHNNYVQALKFIKEDSIALNHSLVELKIHGGTEELEEWQREEVQYLQTLGKEDNYVILAITYVERLQELNDANCQYNNTSALFMIATPARYGTTTITTAPPTTQSYSSELSKTWRLETERWYADKHCQAVLKEVLEMEVKMSNTTRWQPTSPRVHPRHPISWPLYATFLILGEGFPENPLRFNAGANMDMDIDDNGKEDTNDDGAEISDASVESEEPADGEAAARMLEYRREREEEKETAHVLLNSADDNDEKLLFACKYSCATEQAGVLHITHGWIQRANYDKGLFVSKDVCSSSSTFAACTGYYAATAAVANQIDCLLKEVFPVWRGQYKVGFASGCMIKEDPGPLPARAVVHKLQGRLHKDGRDAGPSASFGVGQYSGGEMYIPLLKAKFSLIHHKVGKFKAHLQTAEQKEECITPGRTGTVFFFPKDSLSILEEKPEGWASRTGLGILQ